MTNSPSPAALSATDHIRIHSSDKDVLFWCDDIDAEITRLRSEVERLTAQLMWVREAEQGTTRQAAKIMEMWDALTADVEARGLRTPGTVEVCVDWYKRGCFDNPQKCIRSDCPIRTVSRVLGET